MGLRLGTRGSQLALAQAESVKNKLEAANTGLQVDVVKIRTSGDKGNREQLGAFVHEIQLALIAGEIDIALHCLKDIPTDPVPKLVIAAFLEREDARDAWISKNGTIENLPPNSVVGTGSLRRTSQLRTMRSDLVFKKLEGNIDTRLQKLFDGEYQAIVLAIAGIKRLGLLDNWSNSPYRGLSIDLFQPETMVPATGQGILVLEIRDDNDGAFLACSKLDHLNTRYCAYAERAFLATFGGGCSVPVGAYAQIRTGLIDLQGIVLSEDGKTRLYGLQTGNPKDASALGSKIAQNLGDRGGFEIVKAVLAKKAVQV